MLRASRFIGAYDVADKTHTGLLVLYIDARTTVEEAEKGLVTELAL